MVKVSRLHEWEIAGWIAFALAFAFVGLVPLGNIRRVPQVADQSPLNSTNAVFRGLATAGEIDELVQQIRDLPESRPVVIVIRKGTSAMLAANQLSLPTWPRRTRLYEVDGEVPKNILSRDEVSDAAMLIFLGIEPPATLPGVKRMAAHANVVRLP